MPPTLLDTIADVAQRGSLTDYLECFPYDEQAEINLNRDRCRNLCHVEGKYFVPVTDGSYASMYDYCVDHMIHPDDRNAFAQLMDPDTLHGRLARARLPGALSARFRYKLQGGGWRWVEQCVVGDGRHGMEPGIVMFYVFDIESLVSREQGKTSRVGMAPEVHDARTGLLYEREFLKGVLRCTEDDPSREWCLVAIDIDHFRLFNDWYGREAGDFLLAEVGALLGEFADNARGIAGYSGQDDFRLLAPFDKQRIDELYASIAEVVAAHATAVGFVPVFGIAIADRNQPVSAHELMDQAVMAANSVKKDFRKRINLFKPLMREETEREYRLLSDFLHGLESGEIFIQLQPQCAISSGKIVGVEALARWARDDGSLIPPCDFVPVLEAHGFISNLDRYVWEEACAWLRSWIDGGHTPVPVSVNVSQVDFYMLDVDEHFGRLVEEYELPPELLKVEITESAYIESASVVNQVAKRLHERGFLVLMDDFGSGYSSLNALSSLDVDVLKLDAQLLWAGDNDNHKAVRILESVISMARDLNLPIISEGVENDAQKSFLEARGCRYAQGFHFYRPMNSTDFEALIADESLLDTRGFQK